MKSAKKIIITLCAIFVAAGIAIAGVLATRTVSFTVKAGVSFNQGGGPSGSSIQCNVNAIVKKDGQFVKNYTGGINPSNQSEIITIEDQYFSGVGSTVEYIFIVQNQGQTYFSLELNNVIEGNAIASIAYSYYHSVSTTGNMNYTGTQTTRHNMIIYPNESGMVSVLMTLLQSTDPSLDIDFGFTLSETTEQRDPQNLVITGKSTYSLNETINKSDFTVTYNGETVNASDYSIDNILTATTTKGIKTLTFSYINSKLDTITKTFEIAVDVKSAYLYKDWIGLLETALTATEVTMSDVYQNTMAIIVMNDDEFDPNNSEIGTLVTSCSVGALSSGNNDGGNWTQSVYSVNENNICDVTLYLFEFEDGVYGIIIISTDGTIFAPIDSSYLFSSEDSSEQFVSVGELVLSDLDLSYCSSTLNMIEGMTSLESFSTPTATKIADGQSITISFPQGVSLYVENSIEPITSYIINNTMSSKTLTSEPQMGTLSASAVSSSFIVGQTLQESDFNVTLSGTPVTGFTMNPSTLTVSGSQTITISYQTYTTTVTIMVSGGSGPTPSSPLSAYATSGSFIVGQTLQESDFSVSLNGSPVTGFTMNPSTLTMSGSQPITISYQTYSTSVTIMVSGGVASPLSAYATTSSFTVGQTLQESDFSVSLNGSPVTGFTINPSTLTMSGMQPITISYQTYSTSVTIMVSGSVASPLSAYALSSPFALGYTLQESDFSVSLNGSPVTGFTMNPSTLTMSGSQTITISYQTYMTTVTVTVSDGGSSGEDFTVAFLHKNWISFIYTCLSNDIEDLTMDLVAPVVLGIYTTTNSSDLEAGYFASVSVGAMSEGSYVGDTWIQGSFNSQTAEEGIADVTAYIYEDDDGIYICLYADADIILAPTDSSYLFSNAITDYQFVNLAVLDLSAMDVSCCTNASDMLAGMDSLEMFITPTAIGLEDGEAVTIYFPVDLYYTGNPTALTYGPFDNETPSIVLKNAAWTEGE